MATKPAPAPAYNPMSGNSFVNAVGSTKTTPVVAAPAPVPAPGPVATPYAPGTAYNPTYGNPLNTTATPTVPVTSTKTTSATTSKTTSGTTSKTTSSTTSSTTDPMMQLYLDQQNAARVDAFKLLQDTFTAYGLIDPKLGANDPFLQTLTNLMKGYTDPVTGKITQVGPNEAALLLKQTDAYKNRFKGNQDRLAAGLNVLTEGEYIVLENQYANLFTQYGVSNFANRTEFASLIGKDISNVELNSRLDLAVNQVANASPDIKAQLRAYYPGITDADLTAYFLKPEETLPQLQQKVTSSQIGAAATEQGLAAPTLTRAEELAKLGVSQSDARTGYAKVAAVLPETSKLSQIYGETGIKYGQTEAEQEFLQNQQDVARQRRQLAQLEQGSFSGSSGVSRTPGDSLTKLTQGKF